MNVLTRAGAIAFAAAAIGTGFSAPALADAAPADTGGPTVMAGSSTQSKGGLTCNNQWFNRLGKTNCTGDGSQKWRAKLDCQAQPDIYSSWQYGKGSYQGECNIRISSVNIIWG
ncbi:MULTISPECIES: hypothetical protein [Actinosynnema]|uniref:hypothetical protein n=1 Tax=Actinosynnema TaxID=40566 RepID=UPI0020A40864|nr:hypothetical protein [Actinosynnema pretiosum]MCP2094419.1 hypothetical protein [Actinosynnema pretiosum]